MSQRGCPEDVRKALLKTTQWYLDGGTSSLKRVLRAFDKKLDEALARGYAGVRTNGNAAWLARKDWRRFGEYERILNESLAQKP